MVEQCRHCGCDCTVGNTYASDQRACKECTKKRVRENRQAKIQYYRAYDRKRYRDDPARQAHCQEAGRKHYDATQKAEYARQQRAKHPEKYKARNAVSNALRSGKIQKTPCTFCGSTENLHGHHEDYDHPLDVVWLCASCHGKLHAIKGDLRRGDTVDSTEFDEAE